MPFVVTVGDQSWKTDELTVDEAERIERATERSWVQINPFRSITDAKQILVAFLSRSMDAEAAAAKVGAMSLREILNGIEVAPDDRPEEYEDGIPKAGDGTSTSGSSGPPAATGGPRM